MPSLRLAYEIEKYTKGAITLYDWIDVPQEENKEINNTEIKQITKKINP